MTVYSHSRLSCYEQCPQRFKLQYIDKVETEIEESIEAYLGSRVHDALEKLYRDYEHQQLDSLEELLDFLRDEWKSNWSEAIVIVDTAYKPENYLKMAERYIADYYKRYHPFDQGRTVALEERIQINLDPAGKYKLQGYIDRLAERNDGYYEIHDYKTNSRMPLAEYLRTDRQLALYMIGVKNNYPDVKHVRLIWHFLKFDKELDSTRSDAELEELKRSTIQLIDTIEDDEKFLANPGYLCEWCEFKPVCRQWRHSYKVAEQPANKYMKDTGVQLVNRYAELKNKQRQLTSEIEEELEKLEQAILAFAQKEQVDCVFGSKNKVRITESERYCFPSKNSKDRQGLEDLLRRYGKLAEVSQLDTTALAEILQGKTWDPKMLLAVAKYVEIERRKRLYLSKGKEQ
ncbi:MAG TPA: PD-(D/E)XK nuclease family protein [Candidatus Thermoplasmatota archaeon]|nr:PD-(D/E)XK nuclease family protein [Candidatus Thermoplasmatota archaeon]